MSELKITPPSDQYPLLPLRDVVVFPHMVIPLFVGRPKSIKALETAMEAGKSILVDVSAPWCPTCAKQAPIIQGLESAHPDLVVFEVDFDSAKDVLRQFKVQYQSTLISFKGKAEVARSTGESNPDAIAAQVAKSF